MVQSFLQFIGTKQKPAARGPDPRGGTRGGSAFRYFAIVDHVLSMVKKKARKG
ncbi:MAG: hypothetical protein M0Q23_04200 [Syntrophales bacterium]|jgi:hypothetical protein|nr:hypothetical protein [Syntrophales bacterium]MCK9527843.1 hypothetical protein [Syntrophales bacterium]MDX9922059.1 hypothetical protein [Syntrophales bacterium]